MSSTESRHRTARLREIDNETNRRFMRFLSLPRKNCSAGDYTMSHSYGDRSEQIWYYPLENTHLITHGSRIDCLFFVSLFFRSYWQEKKLSFIGFLIPVQTTVEGETQYLAAKKWGLVLLPAVKLADLQAQHRLCRGFDLSHFIICVSS